MSRIKSCPRSRANLVSSRCALARGAGMPRVRPSARPAAPPTGRVTASARSSADIPLASRGCCRYRHLPKARMVPMPEDCPKQPNEADRFARAREKQAVALLEDYVELIGDLIAETGEARVADIAHRMGVAQPTATKTVGRLKREGLATARPYRGVFLTAAGAALADRVRGGGPPGGGQGGGRGGGPPGGGGPRRSCARPPRARSRTARGPGRSGDDGGARRRRDRAPCLGEDPRGLRGISRQAPGMTSPGRPPAAPRSETLPSVVGRYSATSA